MLDTQPDMDLAQDPTIRERINAQMKEQDHAQRGVNLQGNR
jgi:hypothetical protein